MYLLDTDVVSEMRKGEGANRGVREFFEKAGRDSADLYLSAITIGEIRQGVERIRHRGDAPQAKRLERWLGQITGAYEQAILAFDDECAQVWGRLRVPNPENPLFKLPNVVLSPHNAAAPLECYAKMSRRAVSNLLDYFDGVIDPGYTVNPEVLGRNAT